MSYNIGNPLSLWERARVREVGENNGAGWAFMFPYFGVGKRAYYDHPFSVRKRAKRGAIFKENTT